MSRDTFLGYRRPFGQAGVRNCLAIIPSCGCATHAASMIAARVPGAVLLDYTGGCGETEADVQLASRLLAQCARHPNVIGSIVVSLGCETLNATAMAEDIARGHAPTELLVIQREGGTRRTAEKGAALAQKMLSGVGRAGARALSRVGADHRPGVRRVRRHLGDGSQPRHGRL